MFVFWLDEPFVVTSLSVFVVIVHVIFSALPQSYKSNKSPTLLIRIIF